jgi:uncharacterized protein YoaH (UPF0181 family)
MNPLPWGLYVLYKSKTGWGCYDREVATTPEEGRPGWHWSVGTSEATLGGLARDERDARRYVERIHALVGAGNSASEAMRIILLEVDDDLGAPF